MTPAPIELFYWPTPNCWKVSILLEELGVDYVVRPIDITRGDQYSIDYTAVSPGNRIPAIRDPSPTFCDEPFALFESGAILLYLARKFGRFLPSDEGAWYECMAWLFWQVGALGPMGGQAHHFRLYASERIDYAIERYTNECRRLYRVMDAHLKARDYLIGQYTIADMACLPWIFRHERQGQAMEDFPALNRWYESLRARPAVERGLALAAELRDEDSFRRDAARDILFGGGPRER